LTVPSLPQSLLSWLAQMRVSQRRGVAWTAVTDGIRGLLNVEISTVRVGASTRQFNDIPGLEI